MAQVRCWHERCRKSVCTCKCHAALTRAAQRANEAAMGVSEAATDILSIPLRGQGWEVHNKCAECEGPLKSKDGHYHTRSIYGGAGAEPICCNEVSFCSGEPLAEVYHHGVVLSGNDKNKRQGMARKGINRDEQEYNEQEAQQDNAISKEETEVSKTSQNKKVAAAVKGQKAAKAPRAKKEKAPVVPFVPKFLPKNYEGNCVDEVQATGKQFTDSVHSVKDGKTTCGYDTQVTSKGQARLGANKVPTTLAVNCGRCIRFANKIVKEPKAKKEKAAKKPTPISKGKAVKRAKAAAAASAE